MSGPRELLRELPSLDRLLGHAKARALLARFNREYVLRHGRAVLDGLRADIQRGASVTAALDDASILDRLEARIASDRESGLTRVVNATGTVLHTNLGRALLPPEVVDALTLAAAHPVNLEYDLGRGARGKREAGVEQLLVELTGAEAATVVNNNAAAVLVALNTMASGREVVVSRGELIEIGGAFRLPEIMAKSGALLREVGTTNRTHSGDYERAIGEETGLLLKVHPSNYRVVGFSADVPLGELVSIGKRHGIPVMEDLGSGALVDLSQYGLPKEPIVTDRLALGADVVTFSGDKVLGGPQAGLIVGAKTWIGRIAANPLHRAVRCGKLTLAALEATLQLYRQAPDIAEALPVLRVLTRSLDELNEIGERAVPMLRHALGEAFQVSLEDSTSQIGSGALPTEEIPTRIVVVENRAMGAERIAERFRQARPPIIGRIHDDRFLLDLRTVLHPDVLVPRWGAGEGQ